MEDFEALVRRVRKTRHGFLDIRKASDSVLAEAGPKAVLLLARRLLGSEFPQARMLAVFLLGGIAVRSKPALALLRSRVGKDPDWRVQEILAQAFDRFCSETGYAKALPIIREWLADPSHQVRRAASEGPRIWTARPYFKEHPEAALRLLGPLRADVNESVRKSAGNAIRDISRKHKALVAAELLTWDRSDAKVAQTHKLAGAFLASPLKRPA